jgi:hypothetical protein
MASSVGVGVRPSAADRHVLDQPLVRREVGEHVTRAPARRHAGPLPVRGVETIEGALHLDVTVVKDVERVHVRSLADPVCGAAAARR